MFEEVLGLRADEAAAALKNAGFDVRVVPTLAPGRKPVGEQRVVRVRRLTEEVIELIVVYSEAPSVGTVSRA